MIHIEFLGVPGSGKTTLARALEGEIPRSAHLHQATLLALRSRRYDPLTRLVARLVRSETNRVWRVMYARSPDRFSALARFLDANGSLVRAVVDAQVSRPRGDDRDLILSWILNLMARYQLATEAEAAQDLDALIVDEGFCQRAIALFGYGSGQNEPDDLTRYLRHIPAPDLVVVVDTPIDVCESRLDRRGWSERISGADEQDRLAFLTESAVTVGQVVLILKQLGVRVSRVDGTKPDSETLGSVLTALSPSEHSA